MAGLSLNMGLQGQGAYGSGYSGSATPAAAQQATGPTTIGQKAFGIVTGGSTGPSTAPIALLSTGFLSLVGLFYIYWSLPR